MNKNNDENFNNWITNKTSDFELKPNEEVWLNVNKHLQKKKRRKYFFIWFLTTFIAISTSNIIYFYNKSNFTHHITTDKKVSNTNTKLYNNNIQIKQSEHNKIQRYNLNKIETTIKNEKRTNSKVIVHTNKINNNDPTPSNNNFSNKKDKKSTSNNLYTTNTNTTTVRQHKVESKKDVAQKNTKTSTNINEIHIYYNTKKTDTQTNKENSFDGRLFTMISSKLELYKLTSASFQLLETITNSDSLINFPTKEINNYTSKKDTSKKSKINYELFATLAFTNKITKIKNSDSTSQSNTNPYLQNIINNNSIAEKTNGNIGFIIGTNINIPIYKELFFQTGLRFEYFSYSIKASKINRLDTSFLILTAPINNITPSLLSTIQINDTVLKNKFYNLHIPINIGYKINLPKNHGIYLSTGISLVSHFSKNINIYSNETKRYFTNKQLISNFNISYEANLNTTIPINSKIAIITGPTFRYQILSTYKKDYAIKENLYSIGGKIGVCFK